MSPSFQPNIPLHRSMHRFDHPHHRHHPRSISATYPSRFIRHLSSSLHPPFIFFASSVIKLSRFIYHPSTRFILTARCRRPGRMLFLILRQTYVSYPSSKATFHPFFRSTRAPTAYLIPYRSAWSISTANSPAPLHPLNFLRGFPNHLQHDPHPLQRSEYSTSTSPASSVTSKFKLLLCVLQYLLHPLDRLHPSYRLTVFILLLA